jgi:hypothetical protein
MNFRRFTPHRDPQLRRMPWLALLIFMFLPCPSGRAGTYEVLGAGADRCSSWASARASLVRPHPLSSAFGESQWVLGYISALNALRWPSGDIAGDTGTDAEGMFVWIDGYCAANPSVSIARATIVLTAIMARKASEIHAQNK